MTGEQRDLPSKDLRSDDAQSYATPKPDPFTTWFWRTVQTVGLGIIVEQLIVGQGSEDRPWILLIGAAMMLGAAGVQIGLRAVLRIGS